MAKLGYARVSTDDQTLALQQDALQGAGCVRVFTDTASGTKRERAGLEEALAALVIGDVLVVWKLDRLGRSVPHLLETVARLEKAGVAFCSITEGMDTTTACGKMIFTVMAALAAFERDTIIQRTKAGLAAARARGAVLGAKRRVEPALIRSTPGTRAEVCEALGISEATYFRAMREAA